MHARRTTELVVRCDARDQPPIACEMGAGYPPYFPPLSPEDSAFTVLSALAYGLRGFNVFMAVERDRWIGAPIAASGRKRPFAEFWRRLVEALQESNFHRLHRRVPVRVVVPRVERRLQRVLHAFGPATGAMLAVMGVSPRDSCMEVDLGLGHPLVVDADELADGVAVVLDGLGVPFAWVAGEDGEACLCDAAWIICPTSGVLDQPLRGALQGAARRGVRLSVGPHRPAYDGAMRFVDPASSYGLGDRIEWLSSSSATALEPAIVRIVDELAIRCYPCDPSRIRATLHEDDGGRPKVLFVVNAGEAAFGARVRLGPSTPVREAIDGLTGVAARVEEDHVVLDLAPRAVAMLLLR